MIVFISRSQDSSLLLETHVINEYFGLAEHAICGGLHLLRYQQNRRFSLDRFSVVN